MVVYNIERLKEAIRVVVPRNFNNRNMLFNREVVFSDSDLLEIMVKRFAEYEYTYSPEYYYSTAYKKSRAFEDLVVRNNLFSLLETEHRLALEEEAEEGVNTDDETGV